MGVRKSCGAEGGRVCTVDGDAGRSGRRGKGELGHHDHDEVGDCARRGDAGARRRETPAQPKILSKNVRRKKRRAPAT